MQKITTNLVLINTTLTEKRIAVVQSGRLQHLYVEHDHATYQVGDIYLGKVIRCLPSLQGAFVDIGHEQAAFLPLSPKMQKKVSQQQKVVVQITRAAMGVKGPKITQDICVVGHYLVVHPHRTGVHVSSKLSVIEQQRLKKILSDECIDQKYGYVIRTSARTVTTFLPELTELCAQWHHLQQQIPYVEVATRLYQAPSMSIQIAQDLEKYQATALIVDSQKLFTILQKYTDKVELQVTDNILNTYDLEADIQAALKRQVFLPSGAYLVIEETEAMVTIDVNSGSYTPLSTATSSLQTNLIAVETIARELQVRNLGGLIVIDLIDMKSSHHRQQVITHLRNYVQHDPLQVTVSEISSLGLVQLTRKKHTPSLAQTLLTSCPTCQGQGRIAAPTTLVYEIFRKLMTMQHHYHGMVFKVVAADKVIALLQDKISDLPNENNNTIHLQNDKYATTAYQVIIE